jgi:NADH-quinone oxidoreductase subunit N
MRIDHVALLPAYAAAGTAVLVLVLDLLLPGRRAVVLAGAAVGAAATAALAFWLALAGDGARHAFCGSACSFAVDARAATLMGVFALLTLGVVGLSVATRAPVGEYCFLLACSMTGGVVLAGAADLITLIVALETLTLPLYVLVGLRRSLVSADAAVTFLVVSVVSTAVSLLGAGLLYAATGAVHFGQMRAAVVDPEVRPLSMVGCVLLLGGLAFKVAAVPLHAWAAPTYDGAPLPVAAYLSTASKLGGVVALVYVSVEAVPFERDAAVAAVVVLALLTMTVGNLVALRQRRMVRLLAWSSIAQAGYILAALAVADGGETALTYAVFFVALELGAFAAVIALRTTVSVDVVAAGRGGLSAGGGGAGPAGGAGGAGALVAGDAAPGGGVAVEVVRDKEPAAPAPAVPNDDGGSLADYAGAARGAPWRSAALVLALTGLAGLPPGIAGLFAKVAVVSALVGGGATWLAVIVALNAVVGLAYYVRAAAGLFVPADPGAARRWPRPPVAIAVATAVITVIALAIGFAPQVVFDAAAIR